MFCKNCKKEFKEHHKCCPNCGTQPSDINENTENPTTAGPANSIWEKIKSGNIKKIIEIVIFVAIIGIGAYNGLDDDSIKKNNDGLSYFDSGDSETAISQLQDAVEGAVSNDNKINTLKNLAYMYVSEGQNEQALSTFEEALHLTKTNSFDYYLIAGEIDLLKYDPDNAILNFNKAYELNPDDYQINNTLALFYLDLEEIATQYTNYPKGLDYAKKAYEYDTLKSEVSKQNLAIAHYFNENFDQTISLLSTTNLTQHPHAAMWLGLAYLGKGDTINAKNNFQKARDGGVEVPQELYEYLDSI